LRSSLEGKIAAVTGSGRGIGRAIAIAYGRAGASVACIARTQSEIEETAAQIDGNGGRSLAARADVRDLTAISSALAVATDTFGGLDILVINAGIDCARSTLEESDPIAWREVIETNLLGAYNCARAAVPHLRSRGSGKIIVIGSGLGHRGIPGTSAYACSKAGLSMLARVLAQEVARFDISVNELIPGPVETEMTAPGSIVARMSETEWLKSPDDVVPLALFLAAQPDFGPTAQSFSLMRRDT
jgi:3-oxoacyl-[acyl-carrier protein] reductase